MSLTYEEKKKVIEAAKLLKEHCLEHENCYGCVFYDEGNVLTCPFYKNNAADFEIPDISRWTPEDVVLAKALKALGVKHIFRSKFDDVFWEIADDDWGKLPKGNFKCLGMGKRISIDTSISEAAEV